MAVDSEVKIGVVRLLFGRLEIGRRRRGAHESRRRRRIAEIVEAAGLDGERRRRRWPLSGHLSQPVHRVRIAQLPQIGHPLHEVDGRDFGAPVVGQVELQIQQLAQIRYDLLK